MRFYAYNKFGQRYTYSPLTKKEIETIHKRLDERRMTLIKQRDEYKRLTGTYHPTRKQMQELNAKNPA